MKITESRLNKIISECFEEVIKESLGERNAEEVGMSDDEVIARRIARTKQDFKNRNMSGNKSFDAATEKYVDSFPDKDWDWHRLLKHDFTNNHFKGHEGGDVAQRYFNRYGEKVDIDEAVSNGAKLILQMQELVQQANQAYENAKQVTEDETCLMGGRDNPQYGLVQPITFSRGSVIIVTKSPYERNPDREVIRCFKTVRGVTMKVTDDEAFPYGGYQYAVKTLRNIIKHAQRGIEYFHAMDPNWDDKTQEKFNRKYGM